MTNIIILAILLIPFAILPFASIPEPTRLIKEALFDFTMLGIIVLALHQGLRFEYKNKYLAGLSAWGFFQFGFNWWYPLIRGYGYNAGTITESIHFILAIVATILACSYFERVCFIRIAKAIVISSTAIAVFGICQGIGLDPMKSIATYVSKETRHIAATLDHPNLFGNYMALCIPFCLYLRGIRYKICLAVLVMALLFSQSSISMLAAALGISVFLLLKYRNKIAWISIFISNILFIIFCIYTPSFNKLNTGFTGRFEAWKVFIDRAVNPLFGNGFGVAKSFGVKLADNYWTTPHNDYINIWLSLGFVGVLLFLLVIINTFRNFNYNKNNTLGFAYLASLITFLILMLGSFPMESAPIALIGLVSWWALEKSGSWKI